MGRVVDNCNTFVTSLHLQNNAYMALNISNTRKWWGVEKFLILKAL